MEQAAIALVGDAGVPPRLKLCRYGGAIARHVLWLLILFCIRLMPLFLRTFLPFHRT